ncbi:MAG TPA: TIGR00725 family protein [Kiritimatiellia bacterium]|nr:TIGR00725 family protein [Kiritimatiellia bacterium]HRZ11569.1 TIGR00725 family protein [Kiritimatiellia bacterium]HSA16880.1 TIGR00725 family protein [Kiritimatiellia bacterium]
MSTRPSRPLKIGVLGPHKATDDELQLGREVGAEIARRGATLLCGGLDGVMAAASEGAKTAGGLTIGILPGDTADGANPFIDIAIPTGLGAYRNMLLVRACDAVIAVRGEYGTLSEIAAALRLKVPVVGLQTWKLVRNGIEDPGLRVAATPSEAVDLALRLAASPPTART